MKSYTDIPQSKRLAEFLPIKSADMSYDWFVIGEKYSSIPQCRKYIDDELPCWSLVALLEVIPKRIKDFAVDFAVLRMDMGEKDFSIWYDDINLGMVNAYLPDVTKEEPIDACVEMIIRLHERKLL